MRATFFDPGLESRFNRSGFVTIPFLDAAAVEQVKEIYWRLGPAPGDPRISIHFDFQSRSVDYKEAVRTELREALLPRIEEVLDRHHLFSPAFIMKWPDARSGFAPHQDASIVDERTHRSLSIWCPLVDTVGDRGQDNGRIRFVPGSHRVAHWVRAQNPGDFAFRGLEQAITDRFGVALSLRAGEAVVFDHRTVHFSLPNQSSSPRLAVVMGLRPDEADLLHYRRDEAARNGPLEQFDVYRIDDDYFTELDPFAVRDGVPGYEQVDRIQVPRPSVSLEELERACTAAGHRTRTKRLRRLRTRTRRVNADPYCFRCGTVEGLTGELAPVEHGNVQYLCAGCAGSPTRP